MAADAEIWRFQEGCVSGTCHSFGQAASVTTDSSSFIVGSTWGEWGETTSVGSGDFIILKVDSSGTLTWSWQDGSIERDSFLAAAGVSDGGVVAAGYSNGTWNSEDGWGQLDFAAVKLDSDGNVAWIWQDGTEEDDYLWTCSETSDGNVVVGGYTLASWAGITNGYNNIVAAKIDVNNGTTLWEFQVGTADGGGAYAHGASARSDGSVVLGGRTFGEFANALSGPDGITDFIAVAVDEDGNELWRWQDGPGSGANVITSIAALDDNSVILAGITQGDWDGELIGGEDFAVVKLSSLGVEEWRWQGGTAEDDRLLDAATTADGSVILSGYTRGSWVATYAGGDSELSGDFAALALDADGTLLWTYQAGTQFDDLFTAVAVREDGAILLAGYTNGVWGETAEFDGYSDFAAVLLDADVLLDSSVVPDTPAPVTVAITLQPSGSATPVLQELPVSAAPAPQQSQAPEGAIVEAPVSADTANGSSSSGASLGPIIGGVAGVVALILLVGVVVLRRHRRSKAQESFGNRVPPSRHFPQSVSTATGGNDGKAGGYNQSVVHAAGANDYRQSAAPAVGARCVDPPPPSYSEATGHLPGTTLPPLPPYM